MNLLKAFDLADDVDVQAGMTAYARYNALMRKLSSRYGFTMEEVTAVFVATSPNNDYIGNLKSTMSILDGVNNELTPDEMTVSTYKHCRDRALLYLDGVKFLEHAKGPKTRAFYRNILDPLDLTPVTVDVHVFSAWTGERVLANAAGMSKGQYERIAADMRTSASRLGLIPNQLQGIIWFAWKRIHNIVYDPHLSLWGDHWNLDINLDHVKPYKKRRFEL